MHGESQLALLNLLIDTTFQSFVVADNPEKASDREVSVNQSFSLITFHFSWIIRITLEVPVLQELPVNPVQALKITVITCPVWIGMSVGKHEA